MSSVWVNGALSAADAPVLSAYDHGLLVGDGVFETAKVIEGTPFALTRHLARLERSASGLGLDIGRSATELRKAVTAVIEANDPGVGRLRITVTGGTGALGSVRGDSGATVVIATGPSATWPESVAVSVVPWPRNERGAVAGLKTTSYAENVVALAHAHERDAGEALFANLAGYLCEGTGTNVFVAHAGRLVTPPLSSGCLAGVTRELLLEITEAAEATRVVPLTVSVPVAAMMVAARNRVHEGQLSIFVATRDARRRVSDVRQAVLPVIVQFVST